MAATQPPPHYTSGRYSANNLTQDFREALDYYHEHGVEPYRANSATPKPRTPQVPSSAFTEEQASASRSALASASLGDYTHLTTPDPDDEDDYSFIQSVVVPDPFDAPEEKKFSQAAKDKNAMDVLFDEVRGAQVDPAFMEVIERSSDVDLLSLPDASPVQDSGTAAGNDSNESELARMLWIENPRTGLDGGRAPNGIGTGPADKSGEQNASGEGNDSEAGSDYETNSNWDRHDEVRKRLDEYKAFKESIEGHEKWTETQAFLHKLIGLRGAWPVLERNWIFNFRMRNIYPWVYAPQGTKKRVAINARSNEFRAAKALETLFDLSPLVRSYQQIGMEHRIGPLLHKAIRRHIDWAIRDAGLERRVYIPTLQVYEFDPSAYDVSTSDAGSASDPISDEVEKRLRALAAQHRASLVVPKLAGLPEEEWEFRSPPPLVFAFVIVQHMVMILNHDASHPDNEIVVFSEINMADTDQWLWNALAVTLPVHVARDALWDIRDTLPEADVMKIDDPDL